MSVAGTRWATPTNSFAGIKAFVIDFYRNFQNDILSQRQILGTGNLPQDSAPVCINIGISPEMAPQGVQRNQAFCVTAFDWSNYIGATLAQVWICNKYKHVSHVWCQQTRPLKITLCF